LGKWGTSPDRKERRGTTCKRVGGVGLTQLAACGGFSPGEGVGIFGRGKGMGGGEKEKFPTVVGTAGQDRLRVKREKGCRGHRREPLSLLR